MSDCVDETPDNVKKKKSGILKNLSMFLNLKIKQS